MVALVREQFTEECWGRGDHGTAVSKPSAPVITMITMSDQHQWSRWSRWM